MVFQNSCFFCLNFMLQVNCMQTAYSNGQLPNKFWIWLLVTVEIFKVRVNVRVIFLSKLQGPDDRCNLRLVHFSFWWELQFSRICGVKTSLSSDVSHAQTRLARPLRDKTQMRMAQDIVHDLSFLTTLTIFCVCIIAAKLSVKLLCCLKDKKQRQDCLSWADCYDE